MPGPRRFDHDEALRLFQQGVKISALALHFGVTGGVSGVSSMTSTVSGRSR